VRVGEGGLDGLLAFAVEGRGGFVEQEHGGVFQNRAGEGEALFLAAGESVTAVAGGGFW